MNIQQIIGKTFRLVDHLGTDHGAVKVLSVEPNQDPNGDTVFWAEVRKLKAQPGDEFFCTLARLVNIEGQKLSELIPAA